jgi:hypothetical protein
MLGVSLMGLSRDREIVLFISDSHLFIAKDNLGKGTNNVGEFKALLLLMKFALNKGIVQINIFRDLVLTIN